MGQAPAAGRPMGFTEVDPTDTWVRVGDLSPERLAEFKSVLKRCRPDDTRYLDLTSQRDGSRTRRGISRIQSPAARRRGGTRRTAGQLGFFQGFTAAQGRCSGSGSSEGWHDDETPEVRSRAAALIRELAEHAARNGQQITLEMYEDTYVGTCDEAVKFLKEVGHDACGLNPDIGNLIRLHRPIEPCKTCSTRSCRTPSTGT